MKAVVLVCLILLLSIALASSYENTGSNVKVKLPFSSPNIVPHMESKSEDDGTTFSKPAGNGNHPQEQRD
ncbi:hypothetical protein QR680_005911 [Steinernema hermaphroditum]|uniref:Uncharacterized protein n=1 Tax=Steinernema hermaphroditum TaxID=289476 RepID=A0AA39HTS3_9BILA|nr:hypothetical protein QR680_005911 [Steinernema hermaphroditum]